MKKGNKKMVVPAMDVEEILRLYISAAGEGKVATPFEWEFEDLVGPTGEIISTKLKSVSFEVKK